MIEPLKLPADSKSRIIRLSANFSILYVGGISFSHFYNSTLTSTEATTLILAIEDFLKKFAGKSAAYSFLLQSPYWARIADNPVLEINYDCMDLHHGFGSATVEVEMLEEALLKRANRIIVSSDYLNLAVREIHESLSLPPIGIVKNGADPEHFVRGPSHSATLAQAQSTKKPITVGYFGAMAEWFDLDLLKEVASLLPEIRFEMIGSHRLSADALEKLPSNLRFLGEQPYKKLPALAAHWAAGLIPFHLTDLIKATHPVKLVEYCALGLPVISTAIPEVICAPITTYTASDAATFASEIRRALAEDSDSRKTQRIEYAKGNSWKMRADEFNAILKTQPRLSI